MKVCTFSINHMNNKTFKYWMLGEIFDIHIDENSVTWWVLAIINGNWRAWRRFRSKKLLILDTKLHLPI